MKNMVSDFKEALRFIFNPITLISCSFAPGIMNLCIGDLSSALPFLIIGSAIGVPYGVVKRKSISKKVAKLRLGVTKFVSQLQEKHDLAKNNSFEPKKEIEDDRVDVFISMIKEKMEYLSEVKYQGFEKEFNDLHSLALKYLNAKKELGIVNATDILRGNGSFLDAFNEIESRIEKNKRLALDQAVNRAVIDETISHLNGDIQLNPDVDGPITSTSPGEINLEIAPFRARRP